MSHWNVEFIGGPQDGAKYAVPPGTMEWQFYILDLPNALLSDGGVPSEHIRTRTALYRLDLIDLADPTRTHYRMRYVGEQ